MRQFIATRPPLFIPLLALCVLPALASPAAAQLRDEAGFFSADARSRVEQTIDRVKREYGKSLLIETYPAVPANFQADFQRLGKDRFYEQWMNDRARSMNLDGVYILMTKDPRRLEVRAGRATRDDEFPRADLDQLRTLMTSSFRNDQFDAGILQGADFVYRRMGENVGPEGRAAANRSGAPAGQSRSSFPPPPGGTSGTNNPNRTNAPPPAARQPTGIACGGGSLMCVIIGIVGAVLLFRSVMARRSAGYGQGVPPNAPYGGGPGYGRPGYGGGMGGGMGGMGGGMGGGGFGRGMMGGLLGGVIGNWVMGRMSHGGGASGLDPNATNAGGLPPTDPSTFDSGPDFAGGGSDFGGGGGSDLGGGGADFGGDSGGDSGGGNDF